MFYQRKYSMFTTGGGDHTIQNFGNYSFEICSHSNLTNPDCTTLYEYIGYVTGGFNGHVSLYSLTVRYFPQHM